MKKIYLIKTDIPLESAAFLCYNLKAVVQAAELQGLAGIARDSLPWNHRSGIGRESE